MTIDTPASAETDLVRRLRARMPYLSREGKGLTAELLGEAADCITRLSAGRDAVIEALELAANRLHRCCVDHPMGSLAQIERSEWAQEARAVLKSSPAAPPLQQELVTDVQGEAALSVYYPDWNVSGKDQSRAFIDKMRGALQAALTISKTEE